MSNEPRSRLPPLKLVSSDGSGERVTQDRTRGIDQTEPEIPDIDWTILMARAQDGDAVAYRRLLEEMTPYLRSIAARRHRDASDIEDAVQDVLLTVHSIRHTYDPRRPFGPWLVAIANRCLVDRLRCQGRTRARETPFTAAHETLAEPQANLEEISDRHRLLGAIDKLPPMQKQAIRLLRLREMSLKEAAAASGTSIASLKVATHRALISLRKMLTNRSDT